MLSFGETRMTSNIFHKERNPYFMKKNSKLYKAVITGVSALSLCSALLIPSMFGVSAAVSVTDCDVTRDGIINGKDVIRVMKYMKTDDYYFPDKADVNGDGTINSADITAILSFSGQTCEVLPDRVIETVTPQPTYEQLVEKIIQEAKKVTEFTNNHAFNYGDAVINPAFNWLNLNFDEGLDKSFETGTRSACDRLVSWVFQRAGYYDQRFYFGGIKEKEFAKWKFIKITNINDVRRGDIVLVNNTLHTFICAGPNLRYDHGSAERIQRVGAYAYVDNTTEPFREGIRNFSYAWRPSIEGLPQTALAKIYQTTTANIARPSPDTDTVFTAPNGSGSRQLDFAYNPYNANYELHMNLATSPSSSDNSPQCATFVGVRLPYPNLTPSGTGGIWAALRNDGYVYFYTGTGCSKGQRGSGNDGEGSAWYEPLAYTRIPEPLTTAHKIMVVDTGDVIKYYMVTHNPGDTYLICTIRVNPDYDSIVIRDNSGKFIYSGLTQIGHTGYFGIYAHFNNSTQTNISIECAKK